MLTHILPTISKKQNRVSTNIQDGITPNVEAMQKFIMIIHNRHGVLALPSFLESIVKTIINSTVKRKKKTKI